MSRVVLFVCLWLVGLLAGFNIGAAFGDTYVRDGDTIVVDNVPVRLKGLSCDETNTEAGRQQSAYLKSLFEGATSLSCTLTQETTYDRRVGWCSLDGLDIGHIMIMHTNCQPCRRYDTTGKYSMHQVTGPVPNYCKEK